MITPRSHAPRGKRKPGRSAARVARDVRCRGRVLRSPRRGAATLPFPRERGNETPTRGASHPHFTPATLLHVLLEDRHDLVELLLRRQVESRAALLLLGGGVGF